VTQYTTNDLLWRSREISIIGTCGILNGNSDAIIPLSAFSMVVILEIKRSFRESVLVCNVVNGVDNVECVGTSSIQVSRHGRLSSRVLSVVKVERGRRLLGCLAQYWNIEVLVRDDIVAPVRVC
jgi:hypothetical protein